MGIEDRPAGSRRFETVLAAIALTLVSVPLLAPALSSNETTPINLATVIASSIAAYTAYCAAKSMDGDAGRGWFYIAAGTLAWAGGETLWFYFEAIRGVAAPFPSVADVSYIVAYPLLLAGVLRLGIPLRRAAMLRTLLDAAVIALIASAITWVYVLKPILTDGGAATFETLLSLSYPIGDLLLVFGLAVAALRRPRERSGLILGTLGVGLGLFLVADFAFAIVSQSDGFQTGTYLDVLWLAGYALIALSAVWQLHSQVSHETDDRARVSAPWRQALPLALILPAFVWAWSVDLGSSDVWAPVLLVGALAVVLVRSVLSMRDVLTLNKELDEAASRLEAANAELNANGKLLNKLLVEAVALSRRDSLTGLLNHASVMEELALALKDHPGGVVVAMLDVDHMKRINDESGHQAGDAALRHLSYLLESQDDLVAGRYGGDEFLVFRVATGGSPAALENQLDEVIGILSKSGIGVSHGVAAYPVDALAIAELIEQADRRLYRAKQNRRQALAHDAAA